MGLIAPAAQESAHDVRKGNQVKLVAELGEEDVPVLAQQAGQDTQFSRLPGRDEIPLDVKGGGQGLMLQNPLRETMQETAVGEGHIRETRRGNRNASGSTASGTFP